MTDFLDRVAQLALGLAPAVQPLVVSRYAPDWHQAGPGPLLTEKPPLPLTPPTPEYEVESVPQDSRQPGLRRARNTDPRVTREVGSSAAEAHPLPDHARDESSRAPSFIEAQDNETHPPSRNTSAATFPLTGADAPQENQTRPFSEIGSALHVPQNDSGAAHVEEPHPPSAIASTTFPLIEAEVPHRNEPRSISRVEPTSPSRLADTDAPRRNQRHTDSQVGSASPSPRATSDTGTPQRVQVSGVMAATDFPGTRTADPESADSIGPISSQGTPQVLQPDANLVRPAKIAPPAPKISPPPTEVAAKPTREVARSVVETARSDAEMVKPAGEIVDARGHSPKRPNNVSSPGTAHYEDTSDAVGTLSRTGENRRVAQPKSDFAPEPGDAGRPADDSPITNSRPARNISQAAISQPPSTASTPPSTAKRGANLWGEPAARQSRAELLSSRDEEAANTPAGNVIRITIGRIDVRAVTPPSQLVQPSAPPAPRLSLDEYLRQHSGRTQ